MKNVICYIDDILTRGSTETKHLENLERVLHRLHDNSKEKQASFHVEVSSTLGTTLTLIDCMQLIAGYQ